MLLQTKPKPRPKDTWQEEEHFHWFIKMFIHETKQEEKQQLDHYTCKSKTPRRAQQTEKWTKHPT